MINYNETKIAKKYWHKRFMAIDFGTKFTGLALFCPGSDPYPVPFGRLAFKSDQQLADDIEQVCKDEFVEVLILGVPRLTDGTETNMTKRVRTFKAILEKKNIELHEQDETLSTFEAKDRMKNSPQYNFKIDLRKIDALSASIILEEFIMDDY